ncbi:hypothetical protein WDW89_24360 [Deltaproteobacteria bacterium TL4]
MRSLFFQRPLEYTVEITGEEWNQGDSVSGIFQVKNAHSEEVRVSTLSLILAYAEDKTLKKDETVEWHVIKQFDLEHDFALKAQEIKKFEWTFDLESDCPFSDKNGTLYLVYGGQEALTVGGKIDLKVRMFPILQNFLQTFETQYRFSRKYEKYKSGWVEVKFVPPPKSKDFPTLDQVLCYLKMEEQQLKVKYKFKVQSFGRVGENMKAVAKVKEFEQSFCPDQYLQGGSFPDRLFFRQQIEEALNTAKPGSLF